MEYYAAITNNAYKILLIWKMFMKSFWGNNFNSIVYTGNVLEETTPNINSGIF